MPHLVFLCLAARRIGPAAVKVKAAKVRTFLWLVNLVNFTARFIPDLQQYLRLSASLQRMENLLCGGLDQQQSFYELKKRLSSAETLGYFDKNTPTKVIADASPAGLGAVLVQQQGEERRVISHASLEAFRYRTPIFSDRERSLSDIVVLRKISQVFVRC